MLTLLRPGGVGLAARALLAASVIALSACGQDVIDPFVAIERPATLAELTGPWRPVPLVLDAALRNLVERTCRRDIEFPAGSMAVIIDTRGAGVATVRMSGQQAGSCDALEITAEGQVTGAGGGWRQDGREVLPALDPAEVGGVETQAVAGGNLKIEGWSVYGRVGAAVAHVIIEPVDHVAVTATLRAGWFAAWWPARSGEPPRDGARFPSFLVRLYDASGTLLAEHRR